MRAVSSPAVALELRILSAEPELGIVQTSDPLLSLHNYVIWAGS